MAKKRPTPDLPRAADLIVQRLAKRAPFVMLCPATRRGRAWLRRATDLGDGPECEAYPCDLPYLNPILRAAVADGLTLAERRASK